MFRTTTLSVVPVMGSILFASFLALPAEAATVLAKRQQNGSGACQAAFPPASGTAMRARPLALQNEGDATTFATCSPVYNDYASSEEGASAFNVRLINNGPAAVEVNCTLVDGSGAPSVTAVYLPATVNVPAGVTASVSWGPLDYPAPQPDSIMRPNVSCALPAGVGITYVNYFFQRQVGE